MKRTNKKLTWEQHLELAEKLKTMRDELVHFSVLVANCNLRRHRYGWLNDKRDHRAARSLQRAYQEIDEARGYLESDLLHQFEAQAGATFYYPHETGCECHKCKEKINE